MSGVALVQLEKDLAASAFQAAFQSSSEGLLITEQGRIAAANVALVHLLGYERECEVVGQSLQDILPHSRSCAHLLGQGPQQACSNPVCECYVKRPDGQEVRVEATCNRFQSEGRELVFLRLRAAATDGDRRFRTIFDASAIGIAQCSLNGRLLDCNAALQRMLGYTGDELRGMDFRQFTHAEDFTAERKMLAEMMAGRRESYGFDRRYIRKDGSPAWGRLTVSVVRDVMGTPAFVIAMVEDITECKSTEQQLLSAQKMEAIGRLAGGVAHDFNNLLTGILLYCDLLHAALPEGSPLRRHVEEIRMAGEHGAALTQQLLSIARKQVAKPRPLDLNEIVVSMSNMLKRLIGEQIVLTTQLEFGLPPVMLDAAQFRQIVLNLVLNARDAMPQGGHIVLQTQNTPGLDPIDGGEVSLLVSDDGCGMDAATRSRLFEPFFSTKPEGKGTGLGLTTVYRIVKDNRGEIEVNSEPGCGTQVKVRFPGLPAQPATRPDVPSGQRCILLVDDDAAVRDSARTVLSNAGFRVLQADGGEQAIELFSQHPGAVNLLLVDLLMPGMNGLEVARQLRLREPGLQVVYISGFDGVHATAAGPDLIRKPFNAAALVQRVTEMLQTLPPHKSEGTSLC